MEQRRLRLGDILDDYCPRERRLTNHAVVAMIDDTVKQTRCTTCDAEHVYKGGKVPRRRKQETPAALYKEVLAGMPETESSPVLAARAPRGGPTGRNAGRAVHPARPYRPRARTPGAGSDCRRHSGHTGGGRNGTGRFGERRQSHRGGARPSSAHSRAASAHRGAQGRAPAARVHDSPGRASREDSAVVTCAPRAAPVHRVTTATAQTAIGPTADPGLPARAPGRQGAASRAAAARRADSAADPVSHGRAVPRSALADGAAPAATPPLEHRHPTRRAASRRRYAGSSAALRKPSAALS